MKLVIVDPSKSKSDRIRPTSFHHFRNDDLTSLIRNNVSKRIKSSNTSAEDVKETSYKKNHLKFKDGSNMVTMTMGGRTIPLDSFHNITTGMITKQNSISANTTPNRLLENEMTKPREGSLTPRLDYSNSILNDSGFVSQLILDDLDKGLHMVSTSKDSIIFKMDPKYNPKKKSSSPIKAISGEKIFPNDNSKSNLSPTNNKVKKLTFVKTVPVSNGNITRVGGPSTQNYEKTIFTNSKFVRQSTKYSIENDNTILRKSRSSSNTKDNKYTEKRNSDSLDGIIFSEQTPLANNTNPNTTSEQKFQMYQMDSGHSHVPSRNKEHGIEVKSKLHKSQVNPPILEGYSTYTFKINIKDK